MSTLQSMLRVCVHVGGGGQSMYLSKCFFYLFLICFWFVCFPFSFPFGFFFLPSGKREKEAGKNGARSINGGKGI